MTNAAQKGKPGASSGPMESEDDKRARVGLVLTAYARSIKRMNERGDWPVDSDLVPIMERACAHIDALTARLSQCERDADELRAAASHVVMLFDRLPLGDPGRYAPININRLRAALPAPSQRGEGT